MMIAPTVTSSRSMERRGAFRRNELREGVGVAFGIATGAFVWLVVLSLAHGRL